ncbi:PorT family protein [Vicingaceae bacterium]|nr:PorT family protein [Vicingaceae bacterium]
MIREISLILSLILTTILAKSQESKFRIGFGLKAIESSFSSDELTNYGFNRTLSAIFLVDYQLTDNLFISSGVEYEKKGATGDVLIPINEAYYISASSTYHLHFIQLPLLATYKTKGNLRFFGNLGINFGYLFDQSLTNDSGIYSKVQTNFDEFELSLILGGGLEVDLWSRFDLAIGIRNNRGLTELESANGAVVIETNTL